MKPASPLRFVAAPPRPTPTDLKILRCQRGFLVTLNKYAEIGTMSDLFAFDHITDLAIWLIAEFTPIVAPEDSDGGAAPCAHLRRTGTHSTTECLDCGEKL